SRIVDPSRQMWPTSPPVSRYRRTCSSANRLSASLIAHSLSSRHADTLAPMDAPQYCYRHPDRETGLSCSECGRPICYECMTPAPVGLRCPEHSGKPQGVRKVTTAAGRAVTGTGGRRANLVTMTLIGINLAVYALEL